VTFEPSFELIRESVISARVGAFFRLMSNIFICSPLSSIASFSADLQALTGRDRFLHESVNCSNAGLVESKPIILLFSLVRRVETEKKIIQPSIQNHPEQKERLANSNRFLPVGVSHVIVKTFLPVSFAH
jgi:hypothetical protein